MARERCCEFKIMNNVILVILDGLTYEVAQNCMGFLQALCDEKKGKLYKMQCELPSTSRALYECILTGTSPIKSGVLNNYENFLSKQQSIFHLAKQANLKAGAAAYYWVSELYNRTPFNKVLDRHVNDISLNIPYGHFYYEDSYLDSHLFSDGENLRQTHKLNFTLFHSMNIDDCGHKFSLNSKEYRNATRNIDTILSLLLPKWLDEGLHVIITADHGMNEDFSHGGSTNAERDVPFFVFGKHFSQNALHVKQTEIIGICCKLLGITCDKTYPKEIFKDLK